jgi:competence protein ComEA
MPPGAPGAPALIDLNRATLEQLDSLRGIGPVRGRAILEYRMRVGRFHAVEELLNVNGIGEKTLESVRPFVCVRP